MWRLFGKVATCPVCTSILRNPEEIREELQKLNLDPSIPISDQVIVSNLGDKYLDSWWCDECKRFLSRSDLVGGGCAGVVAFTFFGVLLALYLFL